jgi:hypothetical protein
VAPVLTWGEDALSASNAPNPVASEQWILDVKRILDVGPICKLSVGWHSARLGLLPIPSDTLQEVDTCI